jgi:limonene-1,2-epoxide hydrolase
MTPLEIVNAFMAAAAKRDYDAALALLTDDVEYHNIPLEPVYGPAAVKETIESLLASGSDADWVVHREVAQGDTVMNERTDRFLQGDKWLELPVAGVFVIRDGKIALWHDYFDLDTIVKQMASG